MDRALHFRIGDEEYCISISDIEEVIRKQEIRALPTSPDHVQGVHDYYRQTAEVLDSEIALDTESDEGESEFILILGEEFMHDERRIGFLIDDVFEVLEISEDRLDTSVSNDGVHGAVEVDGTKVLWLKTESIISFAESGT